MSARIIEFRPAKAGRRHIAVETGPAQNWASRFHGQPFEFWRGASDAAFVHSVFTLLECPEIPAANYVLVRRDHDGRRQCLRVGRLEDAAPSLNLAEIRHLGARLGASEVHIHLLADTAHRRRMIELDIAAAEGQSSGLRVANS